MSEINLYQDHTGYKIRATEKAYNLFYKPQGFAPVADASAPADPAVKPEKMTAAELKEYLQRNGAEIPPKAGKKELLELVENLAQQSSDPVQQSSDLPQEVSPSQRAAPEE